MPEEPLSNEEDASTDDDLFEHHRIVADPKQSLIRIDKFLNDRIPNTTRSKIQTAIGDGYIQVNGQSIKANYKIKPGDVATVSLPHPPRDPEIKAENIPLDIRYEDEDLLVVHKPAGMVVHPAHKNWEGTLVNGLVYYLNNLPAQEGNEIRPGLVHRIDKDTSGLLLVAKHEQAISNLAKQFYHHTVERSYQALVWGEPQEEEGRIDTYIGRSYKDRRVMDTFDPDSLFGKRAITHFRVLERLHYVSLVECRLETGRTHQIRIHMKSIGHPLFNDAAYGGAAIRKGTATGKYKQFVHNALNMLKGQALHAKTLGFDHPRTGERIQLDSDLPANFQDLLEKWRNYIHYTL